MLRGSGVYSSEIRDDPLCLHAARAGEPARLLEADLGEVDARHLPAALGQPDRVAALTAGDVERPPGRQRRRLLDEEPVSRARPDQLAAGVAPVPGLAVHRRSHG